MPAVAVEPVLLEYFLFDLEQLRGLLADCYHADSDTYASGGGQGGGPIEGAVVGIVFDGEYLLLAYEVYSGYSGLDETPHAYLYKATGTLTLRQNGNIYRYWPVTGATQLEAAALPD